MYRWDRDSGSKRQLNPAVVALLGTALGILGSVVTTVVSAHYSLREHAEDRADARAKERREALTKTYIKAETALDIRSVRPTIPGHGIDKVADRAEAKALLAERKETTILLELTASSDAFAAFAMALDGAFKVEDKVDPTTGIGAGPEYVEAYKKFNDARAEFVLRARADLGAL